LAPDERLEALRKFGIEHGRHTERTHNLREHILRLNATPSGPGVPPPPADAAEVSVEA
jgi:hypothetical protein